MNEAIQTMLSRYQCSSTQDYINAVKEIIQEIALLGLWRAKFYEHAAFYGGTALRVLYGLDRFSEDLDFSLLKTNKDFSLEHYNNAIKTELNGFGFDVVVETKLKNIDTNIQSAFIKAGTYQQLLEIETPKNLINKIHDRQLLKIKMELDVDPPGYFDTEAKYLLMPIPFSVNSCRPPDLLAGKLHAIMCRQWKTRVKGRDWYDLVWFVARNVPCRLQHLQERLRQSGHWTTNEKLTLPKLKAILIEKLDTIDIESAKRDISLFIKDQNKVELWSKPFFTTVINQITVVEGNL